MISGLIIIDKPVGPSSHDVVQHVRRLSGVRRVGHAGTLDPLASGVLLVCVGQATRLIEYLVGHDKTYETTIRLGQSTTTYDSEGEITRERPVAVSESQLQAALSAFRGPIRQTVPPFSAVKRGGRPLYKAARRGEAVELPVRDVVIHVLDIITFDPPFVTLQVICSSGTYIRSLAHDLGEALECGGHVVALRRTGVGDFSLEEAVALDALTADNLAAHLRSPESAVRQLPRLDVDAEEARRLMLGQRLPADPARWVGPIARVYGPGDRFLGVITVIEDVWQPRKMMSEQTPDMLS